MSVSPESQSYAHVPGTSPLLYGSLPDLLDARVAATPDQIAYVFHRRPDGLDDGTGLESYVEGVVRRTLSFKDLGRRSRQVAASLLRLGVKPGDRVAIYGRPSPEWLAVDLATLRIKVLLVRLPQSLALSDALGEFLERHRCRLLFVDAECDSPVFRRLTDSFGDVLTRSARGDSRTLNRNNVQYPDLIFGIKLQPALPDLASVDDVIAWAGDVDDTSDVEAIQRTIDPDEGALVFPTSGSTGRPKMVTLSHFNMMNTVRQDKRLPLSVFFNDRLFSWIGAFHVFPLLTGARYVHTETAALSGGVTALLDVLGREGVQLAALPGYLLHDVVDALERGGVTRPPSLMAVSSGGERLSPTLRARLLKHIPVHVYSYGCAECTNVALDIAMAARPAGHLSPGRTPNQVPVGSPGTGSDHQASDGTTNHTMSQASGSETSQKLADSKQVVDPRLKAGGQQASNHLGADTSTPPGPAQAGADSAGVSPHAEASSPTDLLSLKPSGDVQVKVVAEDGLLAARGHPGTIHVRSPLGFVGYLDDAAATSVVMTTAGWLNTGDVGVMTTDGKLQVVGRKCEVICRGGVKLDPSVVERTLTRHPAVRAACVVPLPDARYGHQVGACVVLGDHCDVTAPSELRAFLEREMTDSQTGAVSFVPSRIHVLSEDFPRLHSGKVDRVAVRTLLIGEQATDVS